MMKKFTWIPLLSYLFSFGSLFLVVHRLHAEQVNTFSTLANKIILGSQVDAAEKAQVRLFQAEAMARGGWTSGGGEGLACFDDVDAQKKSFDEQGRITEEGRTLIRKLYLLDTWEYMQKYRIFSPVEKRGNQIVPIEDPYVYLSNRLEALFPVAPYLIYRIQESILLIREREMAGKWDNVRPLPKLQDSGVISKEIPKECRRVQLAVRYAQNQGEGKYPKVFVDQDADLVQLLKKLNNPVSGVLFHAGLILHEALYMAAVELGATDSAQVRDMTMFLLSIDLLENLEKRKPQERIPYLINQFIDRGFAKIMNLFVPPLEKGPENIDLEKLRQAASSLSTKHRKAVEDLEQEVRQEGKVITHLESESRLFKKLLPLLTPREAFMMSAYIEQNMNHLATTDQVDTQNVQKILLEGVDSRPLIQNVCGFLKARNNIQKYHEKYREQTQDDTLASRYRPDIEELVELNRKALQYCVVEEYIREEDLLTGKN